MDLAELLRQVEAVEHDAAGRRAAAVEPMYRLLLEVAAWEAGPWRAHAACRSAPVEVFHRRATEAQALDVCAACPVLPQCRTWALGLPADVDGDGVAGGLTIAERRRMRREQRAA